MGNTQFVDVWLHKEPGGERPRITKSQHAESMDDAHRLIEELKVKYGAECGPDDIEVQT
jgi:hypothetical protein